MTRRERRMARAHAALREAVALRDPIAIERAACDVNAAHARVNRQQQAGRKGAVR